MMSLKKKHLFHYTDKDGIRGITSSSMIAMARKMGYGPGVYFTDLPPLKYSKMDISFECFRKFKPGKMRYAVEVFPSTI